MGYRSFTPARHALKPLLMAVLPVLPKLPSTERKCILTEVISSYGYKSNQTADPVGIYPQWGNVPSTGNFRRYPQRLASGGDSTKRNLLDDLSPHSQPRFLEQGSSPRLVR
jgi:hypothetical protein